MAARMSGAYASNCASWSTRQMVVSVVIFAAVPGALLQGHGSARFYTKR